MRRELPDYRSLDMSAAGIAPTGMSADCIVPAGTKRQRIVI
jgi:hypothetical protein